MDWSRVSVAELAEAVRDAGWGKPRSLRECCSKFSLPRDASKWGARVKANAFYFRANYVAVLALTCTLLFARSLASLLAVALITIGVLCVSTVFANELNDRLLRLVRRVHAPTALKLRARASAAQPEGSLGSITSRGKQRYYILVLPRWAALLLLVGAGVWLLRWRGVRWASVLGGALLAVGVALLHASFKAPNLKARLNNGRDDVFRAAWRGYQMQMSESGMGGYGGGYGGGGYPQDPHVQDYTR